MSLRQKLGDAPLVQRLRMLAGYNPPRTLRPWSPAWSVSDLFPWRLDGDWETRFDVTNVPSMIFPDKAPTDHVTVVVYSNEGEQIATRQVELAPFAVLPLLLADVVPDRTKTPFGTFAVFHAATEALAPLHAAGCNIAERGYLQFKRAGDALWGVVHGNLQAMGMYPGRDGIEPLAGRLKADAPYRVPVRFEDVDRFQMTFTNPTPVPQTQVLKLLDGKRKVIRTMEQTIKARGVALFDVTNQDRAVAMVEGTGKIAMWRPAIFKFYPSHYNILHS